MNSTETITPTETVKEKKPRKHLTLEEKIKAAQERLAAKEAERNQLAKTLHSLRASKMNKDRNAERRARNQRLILMGLWFEKILFKSPVTLTDGNIKNITDIKKILEEKLTQTKNEKDQKSIKKEIEDNKILLARLIEIKTQKEKPQPPQPADTPKEPETAPAETPHPRPGTPTRTRQRPTEQP